MKKASTFLFKFLAALVLWVGLEQLTELTTHGFCLQRILATDLVPQKRWETPPVLEVEKCEIAALLNQPYRMIGAGSECFAFKSEDGKAVIKFFKLDLARPVYFHRGIFLEDYSAHCGTLSNHPLTRVDFAAFKRFMGIREFRIDRTFSSIHLAFEHLKEETGLLYLHLNPTEGLHGQLTLYDACGIAHKVDLDKTFFFLQSCAVPVEEHFATLREEGKVEKAQESIDSLVQLLMTRCQKGFADRDVVNRNFGYIGTRAIEIDSGSFRKSPQMREPWLYRQELFYATLELKFWLKKNYPEMVQYLEDRVSEKVCYPKQEKLTTESTESTEAASPREKRIAE
jgi:hypothetical protein